jgi:hypothetical protein
VRKSALALRALTGPLLHLTRTDEAAALPITAGCVVRSAQAVLRPPPTPTRPAIHFPGSPVIRRHAPAAPTPQAARPGRASPVPAVTLDTFRAPYAGESLTAALPGSTPLPWPSPRIRGARHSLHPALTGETSNDAAGFASCYGPHRRSPFTGPLTLGSDPARFPAEPPACYRASWQLPGPDSHRQATTSLRTRRTTMAVTSQRYLPFCWAHEKPGLKHDIQHM